MKRRCSNGGVLWGVAAAFVAVAMLLGVGTWAYGAAKITVNSMDEVLRGNPLPADKTAQVTWKTRASNAELHVLELSKIKLHSHELEDHIVYVIRGQATARLGDETRTVKAGDILNIPKHVPHGFIKEGKENLVFLVVATAGWDGLKDIKFYE